MVGAIARLIASSANPICWASAKKLSNELVAEIDDLGGAVLGDEAVEQRHLSLDVADRRDARVLGQELGQRSAASVEIESRDRTAFLGVEFGEQPRQQRLADARSRRSDDVD